jgi:hypothetical protein
MNARALLPTPIHVLVNLASVNFLAPYLPALLPWVQAFGYETQ